VQVAVLRAGLHLGLSAALLHGAPVEEVAVDQRGLFAAATTSEALHAAARSVAKALADAQPAVLHPLMPFEVLVPADNLGSVLGDLQQRRSEIQATDLQDGNAMIRWQVALPDGAGELARLTHGPAQPDSVLPSVQDAMRALRPRLIAPIPSPGERPPDNVAAASSWLGICAAPR
jgi:translation elongation factor EF-G